MRKRRYEEYLSLLSQEIEETGRSSKPIQIKDLQKDSSNGIFQARLPFCIEGDGIIKIPGITNEHHCSVTTNDGIVSIAGIEDLEYASLKEAFIFLDQLSLLKKVQIEFANFQETEVISSLFNEEEVLEDTKDKVVLEELNASQNLVLNTARNKKNFLVVGPAGTGKTKVISEIIKNQISAQKRVLVVSNANMAVENVFESLFRDKNLSLEQEDVVIGIKTNLDVLKKHQPKAIAEKKYLFLNDEKVLLVEIKDKLISQQTKLQTEANALIGKLTNLQEEEAKEKKARNLLSLEIKNLTLKMEELQARIAKLKNNSLIAAFQSLISGDKIEELELEKTMISEKLNIKKTAFLSLVDYSSSVSDCSGRLEDLEKQIETIKEQIKVCAKRLQEIKKEVEENISANVYAAAKIAGATLTSAAINKKIAEAKFDIVIVDEGSMATMPLLLLSLSCAQEQVIIFGDPAQLSPVAKTSALKKSIFDEIGISDKFRAGEPHSKAIMLDTQFRCNHKIAAITSKLFYGGKLKNGKASTVDAKMPIVIKNTNGYGAYFKAENGSFTNPVNAKIAIEYVKIAIEKGQNSIAVITPFKAQASLIQDLFDKELASYEDVDFKAATIHSFQGKEKDFVIFDLTFGQTNKNIGMPRMLVGDKTSEMAKLLNVAMTRSRNYFVVICDVEYTISCLESMLDCEQQILYEWIKTIQQEVK